jgi:thiol peroxidase
VRNFNERASGLKNTAILCISRDTPFAQGRFVNNEELKNVINLSDIKDGSFGKDYGLTIAEGPFETLHSRAVVVLDENGQVLYNEQVPEIAQEPNYLAALKTLL